MEKVTFIRYTIQNIQPLRIADDSTSQSGQTSTLKYIPGTTIRGYVVNRLCHDPKFESIKQILFFGHVRFMNCSLVRDDVELLPPLKGFYEDKSPARNGEKQVDNVTVNGTFREGNKRASLGSACRIDGGKIYFYHVETGSDMKIRIKLKDQNDKQNVFRSEYIQPGNTFAGYVAIDEQEDASGEQVHSAAQMIFSAFGEPGNCIVLGNARTAGMGLCRILALEEIPEEKYCRIGELPKNPLEKELYMILLSNTVMRDELGRYCGLNLPELEKKLGVSALRILQCSTSAVDVRGYNSHLHLKAPSLTMYERGSVFHFSFQGSIDPERLERVSAEGIGVRRNEGFGQVLFAEPAVYEKINVKKEVGTEKEAAPVVGVNVKDEDTLKIIAKNYLRRRIKNYFNEQITSPSQRGFSGNASESQKGSVRALLLENKYDFAQATKAVSEYFGHAQEKQRKQKIHKETAETSALEKFVTEL